MHCRVCNRTLRNPAALEAGIGATCAARLAARAAKAAPAAEERPGTDWPMAAFLYDISAANRRTWRIRNTAGNILILVKCWHEGERLMAECLHCKTDCQHIAIAAKADRQRFTIPTPNVGRGKTVTK